MNKIILTGRLGNDPDIKSTPSGASVCSFSLAVEGKKKDQITWYKINAWRQLGETCARYLSKGKKCAVIGEIQPRLYESKDGKTRMSLDVQADEVEFLTPKSDSRDDSGYQPSEPSPSGFTDVDPGDIPF